MFWFLACIHSNMPKKSSTVKVEDRQEISLDTEDLVPAGTNFSATALASLKVQNENRMSPEDSQSLGRVVDSICRAYTIPEDLEQKGCTVLGPYQGIIQGDAIGDVMRLNEALKSCLENPICTGVSTDWYLETPFIAYSQTEVFNVDSNSYGCSFVVTCS